MGNEYMKEEEEEEKEIEEKNNDYEPNILFLKDYIIIYENNTIHIYNLFGELKTETTFLKRIKITKLYDNEIIIINKYNFISYRINNGNLEELLNYQFTNIIQDIIYLEKYNFLIVNFKSMIKLFDYYNLEKGHLQVVNKKIDKLYNLKICKWNDDMIIGYNYSFIILFQKVNNSNSFQILSKVILKGKKIKDKIR